MSSILRLPLLLLLLTLLNAATFLLQFPSALWHPGRSFALLLSLKLGIKHFDSNEDAIDGVAGFVDKAIDEEMGEVHAVDDNAAIPCMRENTSAALWRTALVHEVAAIAVLELDTDEYLFRITPCVLLLLPLQLLILLLFPRDTLAPDVVVNIATD